MKVVPFFVGLAAGAVAATAAVTAIYPDVSRRMMRDSRHAVRCGKRAVGRIGDIFTPHHRH